MLLQDRLEKIKEERARRYGTSSSDFNATIERVQKERQARIDAVREAEQAENQPEAQKKTENTPKPFWWEKTKAFLSKYPRPIDYLYKKGTEVAPVSTEVASSIGQKITEIPGKIKEGAKKEIEIEKDLSPIDRIKRRYEMGIKATAKAGELIADIPRYTFRGGAKIGATATELATGEDVNYKPTTKVGKYLLGDELTSLGQSALKAEETIKKMGGSKFEYGVLPVLGITGSVFADIYPGGSAEKRIIKEFVSAGTKDLTEKVATKYGMKLSDEALERLAKEQTEKGTKNILKEEAQKVAVQFEAPKVDITKEEEIAKLNRRIGYIEQGRRVNPDDIVEQGMKKDILEQGIENAENKAIGLKPGNVMKELEMAQKSKKSSIFRKISDAFFPMKNQDEKSKEIMGKYFSGKIIAKESANKTSIGVPKLGMDEMVSYQKGELTPNSGVIKNTFDDLFSQAEKAGFEVPYRQNYIPQIYNNSREEVVEAVTKYMKSKGVSDDIIRMYIEQQKEIPAELASRLGMTPRFTLNRVFPSYEIASQFGLKPKFTNLQQLAGYYKYQIESNVVNRDLVENLVKSGRLSTVAKGEDWVMVNAPRGYAGYFAEPKLASMLNGMFENVEAMGGFEKLARGALSGLATASRVTQEFALSGGVPKTNLNFWTFGQAIKSLTAIGGDIALTPVRGIKSLKSAWGESKQLANAIRSNFTKRSIKWFGKKQPIIDMMAEKGLDLGYRLGQFDEVGRGLVKHFSEGDAKHIFGEGFNKLWNEKTFKSFAPMQAITTFEDSFNVGLKRGMDREGAKEFAAEVTRNFQGLINAPGRSGLAKDFLTAGFFAPRFRESIVNVIWNTIKSVMPISFKGGRLSLGNLFNPAFAKNRSLLAGVTMSYLGYNYLNKKFNEGDNMWDNVPGKELELKIPAKKLPKEIRDRIGMSEDDVIYIPLMPSFMAMPRNIYEGTAALAKGDTETFKQKAGSFFSMPIKTMTELATNKDYFGRQIYDPNMPMLDQLTAMSTYAFFANSHPYLKIASNETKRYLNQDKLDKFKEIISADNAGDTNKVSRMVALLNKEDKKAYYDLKNQKIKPLYQSISEGLESPIRFTTEGSIQKQEYYQKMDEVIKEIKKQDSPEEQALIIQEYISSLPEEKRRGALSAMYEANISTTGISISEDIIRMKPTYNKVQDLISQGKNREAQVMVDKLSEEDYKAYQKVRASINAKKTKQLKLEMQPLYNQVQELIAQGKKTEAQKMVNKMSDEEYRIYKLIKESS